MTSCYMMNAAAHLACQFAYTPFFWELVGIAWRAVGQLVHFKLVGYGQGMDRVWTGYGQGMDRCGLKHDPVPE